MQQTIYRHHKGSYYRIIDHFRIQLNDEVTVTLTLETDIGLFGGFGSFPITLTASATGKSEVYWK